MKKYECAPTSESTADVLEFVRSAITEADVPIKAAMQINIAVDEMYSNIVKYSGAKKAITEVSAENGWITLRFYDDGAPYDPTQKSDPDVTLSSEERSIGGLGIFLAKKSMDGMEYEYRDGFNILTIRKRFG